jgi:hypothetical protein
MLATDLVEQQKNSKISEKKFQMLLRSTFTESFQNFFFKYVEIIWSLHNS